MHSLEKILRPKSIVLIGVSRKEGSLGKKFLDAILRMNYRGEIYIINPKADRINGIQCFASLAALPQTPDLGVILLPSQFVLDSLKELGEAGVKDVIVVSAGFKEVGGEGLEREKQLVKLAQKYDMNLVGPNCMGIFNTDPEVMFNGTFSPTLPRAGHVAYISQSGALGVAILELAAQTDLGFSVFVSTGNKAVISEHDILRFLKNDTNTNVITLYLESIDNPQPFMEACQSIVTRKPVLAVKAGKTDSGQRAASSHTGALANPEHIVNGFLKQAGVIRCETLEEMFDLARALSLQHLPKGPRVAIVTNAGGPGILASDALESCGLQLAELQPSTIERLKDILPPEAACANPVDMIASADHDTYHDVLEVVLKDPQVDSVVLIIVKPPVDTTPAKIVERLEGVVSNCAKTIIPVLMAQRDETAGLELFSRLHMPIFSYPETAVKVLGKMWDYQQLQQRFFKSEATTRPATLHTEQLQKKSGQQLPVKDLLQLLDEYKIPVADFRLSENWDELETFFKAAKGPVVLKIANEQIIHKTEEGFVRLALTSLQDLKTAFEQMSQKAQDVLPPHVHPLFLVQKQLSKGLELVLGGKRDPLFGPVLMVGLGGIFVEVLKDVAFRIAPVNVYEAQEMLNELRGQKLMKGFRNIPPLDFFKFGKLIHYFSLLLAEHPEIAEIDLNPLIWGAGMEEPIAVDFRATFAD
ncbi:acetate--CoA ligase family protein [Calditrichota bacterium GD2]